MPVEHECLKFEAKRTTWNVGRNAERHGLVMDKGKQGVRKWEKEGQKVVDGEEIQRIYRGVHGITLLGAGNGSEFVEVHQGWYRKALWVDGDTYTN